jgi:iron complex outermembrane recepter protein
VALTLSCTAFGGQSRLLSGTSLAAALFIACPVHAQNLSDNSASAGSRATPDATEPAQDEIVVSARRRDESLQDVPLAVAVIDDAAIEATGSYNVQRLTQLQPSVQYFASNPRNSSILIRGLGAPFGLTNDGIEQGVGLYIDQVYYSRPAAASFDFIDVDQIEVLRGPQGTLYGKNVTAGALNITTRKPSFTPEARAEITAGNLDFFQGKASVSGPLIDDKLAARLAITGTSRKGTLLNVNTNQDVNAQRNIGVRGSVLWKASSNLDITVSGDFNRQNPECCTQVFVRVAPTLRPANRQFEGLASALGYTVPSRNPFDRLTDNDSELNAEQNFGGASLLAQLQLGAGTLTSVTAWRFWDWKPSSDRDFTGLPITTISANPSKQRQITQEFRYASDGAGYFDYVVGLFGYRQVIDSNGVQQQGAAASLWLLGPTNGSNPALLNGLRQDTDIHFENNSLALFGRLTWRISDTLRIEPGVRFNYDTKKANYIALVSGGLVNPTPALQRSILSSQAYGADFKDGNVAGDVTISWEPVDTILAYGTYSRSFKSGGVNLGGLPNDANGTIALSLASVKPEKVNHIEFGLKTELFDRKARLNLSAFRTDVGNYQASVVNGQVGVLRGYLANADKVRVQGIEAEFSAKPVAGLSLYANGALIDAKYRRFVDAPCAIEFTGGPQACDISGQDLPGISKWTISYGAEYAIPAGSSQEVYAGLDGSYKSAFSSSATPSQYTRVAGYGLLSLRAGWRNDDGWNIFGWVRNVGDKGYFDYLTVQPGNSGLIVGQPGDPRTWGVTLSKKY